MKLQNKMLLMIALAFVCAFSILEYTQFSNVKKNVLAWELFRVDFLIQFISFVFLLLIINWLLRRYFANPLSRLDKGLQGVAAGEYGQPLEGLSGEMNTIAGSFEQMAAKLSQREEELKANSNQQSAISSILEVVQQNIPIEGQLANILDSLLTNTWVQVQARGAIFLVDEDSGALVLSVQHGFCDEILDSCANVPFGKCLCGRAAETGEVVFSDSLDERHEISYEGINPHGHYCVPIKIEKKVLGVINLYLDEGHKKDRSQEDFLMSVGNAIGALLMRKQAEEALLVSQDTLKANETKYRLIHDTAFDAIIVTDIDGSIVECNMSANKTFGYEDSELLGRSFMELLTEEFRESMAEEILQLSRTGNVENQEKLMELYGLRKSGKVFPIELTSTSFELRGTPLLTTTIRDITERKVSEESIKHMAYHDGLTGLPNRLLFIDRLDQVLHREVWRNGIVAVLFLDLNRFKVINDTFGHAFGDELLKVVARRLEGCLREGDTVARQGGDEFTILLQDLATVEDIPLVLEKILDAIKQPIVIESEELIVGTSIGVSVFPDDGFDGDTLLKNADAAMYRAKKEGTSCFQLYSTTMSIKAAERLKMEHKLSKALDNKEFTVHYQPQMDIKTGKLVGMEALVRLNDFSSGKLIPPGDFIPVAEETGIIIPLSEWVLRTACEQTKCCLDAGYPQITVAVNMSPKVFRQKNFIQTVVGILEETGLKPECLEIEITEETMLVGAEEIVETMTTLREFGVRFAIDDFGTGYSSLSYLKRLPIELLKIDRSFINDIFTSSDDKAIVTAIIQMAHSMGIEVLAEGVETEQQLAYLNSLGCDKLQGYLFSKPVPYDEFEKLLDERTPSNKKQMRDVI